MDKRRVYVSVGHIDGYVAVEQSDLATGAPAKLIALERTFSEAQAKAMLRKINGHTER